MSIEKGMVNDFLIVWVFGIFFFFLRIIKAFQVFIGKRIINDYCIISVFGI